MATEVVGFSQTNVTDDAEGSLLAMLANGQPFVFMAFEIGKDAETDSFDIGTRFIMGNGLNTDPVMAKALILEVVGALPDEYPNEETS